MKYIGLHKLIDENGVLIVPEGTKYIQSFALQHCAKLKKVILPNSLISIGMSAFDFCYNLKEVIFNEGLKKIDEEAFDTCSKLKSIVIPSTVEIIKGNPFLGCGNLKSIVVSKDNPHYDSRDNCNAIIRTKTNKLICGCTKTKIPSTITTIGETAFAYSKFKTCKLPSSIKKIEERAFVGCKNLRSIEIPENVKIIEFDKLGNVFGNCKNLSSIKVSPLNKVYDSRNDCNALIETKSNKLLSGCISTTIPKTITSIENNAFFGSNIESIIIPDNVKEIGPCAFLCCEKLVSVKLPSSLKVLSHHLFAECSSLEFVEIPESVETIDRKCFADCESMKSLFIPKNVSLIKEYPFSYYNKIESLKVDSLNKTYDSRNDCNAIIETKTNTLIIGCESTIIPDSVKVIGEDAFSFYLNLKNIIIPRNVTKISNGAFNDCQNLESVTILNENTIIEEDTFIYCKKLKYLTIGEKKVNAKKYKQLISKFK